MNTAAFLYENATHAVVTSVTGAGFTVIDTRTGEAVPFRTYRFLGLAITGCDGAAAADGFTGTTTWI